MIEIHAGLVAAVAATTGSATFELRGCADQDLGERGMRQARAALFKVPHPEEPDDPLPSGASRVTLGFNGPQFTVDIADAEAYPGLLEQVVRVMTEALDAEGASGTLALAGHEPPKH